MNNQQHIEEQDNFTEELIAQIKEQHEKAKEQKLLIEGMQKQMRGYENIITKQHDELEELRTERNTRIETDNDLEAARIDLHYMEVENNSLRKELEFAQEESRN